MRSGVQWTTNPLAYELEILTLVNNEGVGYDIRELMLECNIYEAITSNFLMGEIAISDAVGLLENAKIFGQETLRIRFSQPSDVSEPTDADSLIDQVFRIYKVSGVHRIGQNTTVYKLSFCAPELIHAKRTRVSRALRGSLTEMAGQIATEELGIEILEGKVAFGDYKCKPFFENIIKSQGDNYHVVIPNWTINYAINWLMQQSQGASFGTGFYDSFFFFQTARGGYRIQSIGDMATIETTAEAFYYAPAAASGTEEAAKKANKAEPAFDEAEGSIGAGRRILDYTMGKTANVLEGVLEGLFGQKQITVDNIGKYQTETTYDYLEKFYGAVTEKGVYPLVRNMEEVLSYGEAAGAEEPETRVLPYTNTKIQGKRINEYPDAHTTLTSTCCSVFDKESAYNQANHETELGSEQVRTAIRSLLKYNTINALISSRTDISCGEWITLKIPATTGNDDNKYEGKFHSGQYLITEIKWSLTGRELRTNIKCVKDSYINRIETADAEYAPMEIAERKG